MNGEAVVLGFDTSCYTTSVAAVDLAGRPVASCRRLLPVPAGSAACGRARPCLSMCVSYRCLWRNWLSASAAALLQRCAHRYSPRDEQGSYMPVFQAGDAQARGVAALLGVPCFASNHQRGHLEAALVDSGVEPGALLALHLSGGTTELLAYDGERITLLGGSLDLHAGQLVDRVGVALGLPFPAGPHLEELAVRGTSQARLPVSMEQGGLYCHLSGAETQLQRWITAGEMPAEHIAREAYDLLARTVARMVLAGARKTGLHQVLLAGGVASSALFRELVTARVAKQDRSLRLHFGRPEYSGDNAVGVARIGAKLLRAKNSVQEQTQGG